MGDDRAVSRPAGGPAGAEPAPEVLIVTGLSGAGRTTVARALEDIGWFVIDNLPPSVLPRVVEEFTDDAGTPRVSRLAVVVDARGQGLFGSLREEIDALTRRQVRVGVLFLEATDPVLVRRFESSRRPHPLQRSGRILDALRAERRLLGDVRAMAERVIDTSSLTAAELRRVIEVAFGTEAEQLRVTILSFGFKHGLPIDADMVVDARFLPNPFWVPELSAQDGRDVPVRDYVLGQPGAADLIDLSVAMIDLAEPGYLREGKRFTTLAIGCTGGRHRSVALASRIGEQLRDRGMLVNVVHRDVLKD